MGRLLDRGRLLGSGHLLGHLRYTTPARNGCSRNATHLRISESDSSPCIACKLYPANVCFPRLAPNACFPALSKEDRNLLQDLIGSLATYVCYDWNMLMLWFYVNVCKQNKFINIVLVNKTFIDSNLDKLVHDVFRQRVLWILPTVRTDNFLGQSLEQNPTKNTLTY